MGGISVASERLRAQPAILHYRGQKERFPVGNMKRRRSIEGEMEMPRWGCAAAPCVSGLDEQREGQSNMLARMNEPVRCIFEFFRRLGTRRTKLGCHRRNFQARHLDDDLRFAIENSGQSHQGERSTSRTLDGAIAHAVAILTKIRRRQGDVLHRGECHWPTSKRWCTGKRAFSLPPLPALTSETPCKMDAEARCEVVHVARFLVQT